MNTFSSNKYYEKFFSRVKKTRKCWNWTGAKDPDGYGYFHMNRKNHRVHRLSYEHFVGKIPEGLVTDHLCRNPSCVNPKHLEAVTNRVNSLRGVSPLAVNFFKEKCIHGHPFDEKNTYRDPKHPEERVCKECKRYYQLRRKRKKAGRELPGRDEKPSANYAKPTWLCSNCLKLKGYKNKARHSRDCKRRTKPVTP